MHPMFQRIFDTAPHAPPTIPVICRRCDGPYQSTIQAHDACCESRAVAEISTHDANEQEFIAMLQAQIKATAGVPL